jgi:isohexenylglutaconyl-CoA hydratase
VRRLGLSQTRRLAVTGGELDGRQAADIGLVHRVCEDGEALDGELERTLDLIDRCAPAAIAVTKELIQEALLTPPEALVDRCAAVFAAQARGPEGAEGMAAFIAKRPPAWSVRQRLDEAGARKSD